MTELLPTLQAASIRRGLVTFLSTTFALSEDQTRAALEEFLDDPVDGVFKGPYARLRLPFQQAADGWRDSLDWVPNTFPPYGHQARAWQRLSAAGLGEFERPLPTLVTTGTGSGKTESFTTPIFDHVIRAKARGERGIKAIILYPMNALANDQAGRLAADILREPALAGVRAAIYTGQKGPKRKHVTKDGLINDRYAIRNDPPDILLTNYKMLDQLLLRPQDQVLWEQSALSLRYLVLDEFHTYDGAQGTDVAMLLRRLGLALKRHWPAEHEGLDDDARRRPLGLITPVATSATLGDKGDPSQMLGFAETVFGEAFDESCVVTETRLSVAEWAGDAAERVTALGYAPRDVDALAVGGIVAAVGPLDENSADLHALTRTVLGRLWQADVPADADDNLLFDLVRAHPFIHRLAEAAEDAVSLADLGDRLLGGGLAADETFEQRTALRETFLTALLAVLGHLRKVQGRDALSLDVHLWIRSLTRVDRVAGATPEFRWTEQVTVVPAVDPTAPTSDGHPQFPAIYCRHCGRSGWGVQLAPTGSDLAADDADIRADHMNQKSGFRALLFAPQEADRATLDSETVAGLQWFRVKDRRLTVDVPRDDDEDVAGGWVLPVLALTGDDIETGSRDDVCPSCERTDGIRFLGSAIATMLSVAVTSMFGDRALDPAEKKALVFTDSVQDAAHRAGFVQSRAHVFGLRNAIRRAVGERATTLDALVETLLQQADDAASRYRLLAPDIADHEKFRPFWEDDQPTTAVRTRVKRRLALDLALEFGLQSRVGRTLERTGSLAAEVDAGSPAALESIARAAIDASGLQPTLDADTSEAVVRWVRGVLERMRDRGAIKHSWFERYIENDGRRYFVWGGRPRGQGMPAFPEGRDAPGYPRFGSNPPTGSDGKRTHLDVASSAQSWFATWTRKNLGVSASDGAKLTRALFEQLQKSGIVGATTIANDATVYHLDPERIAVMPVALDDLRAGRNHLICDVCSSPTPASAQVVDQLLGAPCLSARCPGRLRRHGLDRNYYRDLYDEGDMRRVVAREHTSLLDDTTRLAYEQAFKASDSSPDSPNVLVATPTLEMGIDIGDLSAVLLAGLPKTVASYLQRVGRAGRLTGNALSLAFVTGRGDQLPKIGDPLSVVNGKVQAPATYLDAEEILHRQYVAHLLDRRSGLGGAAPKWASDVLKSSEPGSFLGDLVVEAEAGHDDLVAGFLATFDSLGDDAIAGLRAFGRQTDAPGTSPLAEAARSAVQRWTLERDTLKYRRATIEKSLPELEAAAEHAAATEDAKMELRAAKASLRLVSKLLADLRKEPWISALERFGLLPNYTLLDDTVRLDVSLSWIDPDTNGYAHESLSYDRGAAVAIAELAPGAKFYVQGIEIEIDAVDLGRDGDAVHEWAFCPSCGFGADLRDGAVTACPRCGGNGIADTGQRMPVVELEHVSAEVRRDESTINDRRDERDRVRFTLLPIADIAPDSVTRQWHVEKTGLNVKYLRDLTVRWLNLGRTSTGGGKRSFAGADVAAPLFRVCDECGKLDTTAGANSRREHRAWCRHRAATGEHVTTVALSRTLRTQGVVLRLPARLTVGDSLAVPSLSAAIRLGLREMIGGDPDHLRMLATVDPDDARDGTTHDALLIHDAVPGGSGYLADLADAGRMRTLLEAAWRKVENCECIAEGRAACHRCLLPFIDGANVELISRASAARSLRELLQVDDGGAQPWDVQDGATPVVDAESHLEAAFRALFLDRAKTIGTVKELPGDSGSKIQVTMGAGRRIWRLDPQVQLGATTPDFLLEQVGGNARSVAIYTDGRRYHASVQHNRLADDAEKRRFVRDQDHIVIAVTARDLQIASLGQHHVAAPWFDVAAAQQWSKTLNLSQKMLDSVTMDPLTRLMAWMQDPEGSSQQWGTVARHLPLLVFGGATTTKAHDLGDARHIAIATLQGAAQPGSDAWIVRQGAMVFSARRDQALATSALFLDDRDTAMTHPTFDDDWRAWLIASNVLGFHPEPERFTIATLSPHLVVDASAATGVVIEHDGATEHEVAHEGLTDVEAAFIDQLAGIEDIDMPEVGAELGDGIPVALSWPAQRIAAGADLNNDDRAELAAAGWTVVDLDLSELRSALRRN